MMVKRFLINFAIMIMATIPLAILGAAIYLLITVSTYDGWLAIGVFVLGALGVAVSGVGIFLFDEIIHKMEARND